MLPKRCLSWPHATLVSENAVNVHELAHLKSITCIDYLWCLDFNTKFKVRNLWLVSQRLTDHGLTH